MLHMGASEIRTYCFAVHQPCHPKCKLLKAGVKTEFLPTTVSAPPLQSLQALSSYA